ncbi:MAG: alpha-1,4-glucan--maltose-1-phosphate maltosyltransferase [Acidimicrobiia bacterium]|nr:alpha-1,4-glucan--maltose-1-phosphate maltosyltransferase [Acidimicrobiia bacterium]
MSDPSSPPSVTDDPAQPPPRLVLREVHPQVAAGRYPLKRVVGEPVDVEVVAVADGHVHLALDLVWSPENSPTTSNRHPMQLVAPGLDRWGGRWVPPAPGRHHFHVEGWVDHFATWLDGTRRKVDDGQSVRSELLEGAALLESAAEGTAKRHGDRLRSWADEFRSGGEPHLLLARADDGSIHSAAALYRRALRPMQAARSVEVVVDVEHELALCSSWYELFPRSWGPEPGVHGTLADVAAQIDYVADMGFDIVYLPPIHPIGHSHRKGPDNTTEAGPDDPGSPWAIGSADGGHLSIHPSLGTFEDFDALVAAVDDRGMRLALDVAFQCSPDHPWVTEHPEWFRHRPDGSIHYAENPPKKYQDIYPLDFESTAWRALWEACRDVFGFWAERGVRVFRVDNPHTKPFAFWEWCLADIRRRWPDTIFLSEAFTRPEVMHQLAMVGFTQSYNYFPWRVSADELRGYFTELAGPPSVDQLRPSSWPTTPDILPWHLQRASRRQFAVRAVLAATLSPSWGVYGPAFELSEATPADNGKEEFGSSEKYELRWWERSSPDSLRGLLTMLNTIRRDHRALRTLRTLRFHGATDEQLLVFSKTTYEGPVTDPSRPVDNPVVVVVNLDPDHIRLGELRLDLSALGIDDRRPYLAHDALGGETYEWAGSTPYVELHPQRLCAHVLRLAQPPD